jgi:hypothetical protein
LVDLRLKSLSDAPEDDAPEDDEPEDDEPEQLNTLDTLVGSYLKWFKQLDVNLMAEKLAKLEAIHTMKKEGYKPDPSEVEALL